MKKILNWGTTMVRNIFLILIMIITPLATCSCAKQSIAQEKRKLEISSELFTEDGVEISFPQLSDLKDIELQNKMNIKLKEEAFREYQNSIDFFMSKKYEIIYQDEHTISVIYSGYAYNKNAAYPRDTFTTINIDLQTGDRIQLKDIVKIDDGFVIKLRETLSSYIDKNPDWEPVYSERLKSSNEYLLNLLWEADSEKSGDCFSYLTKDYLGLIFSTSHVAGDHFEIKVNNSDIKEYIK